MHTEPANAALRDLIVAIHKTPHKAVLELAGAGTVGLAWLHAEAGSSRTVLEAGDRYSPAALVDLIGLKPTHFAAPEVAQMMAHCAFLRTQELDSEGPWVGLGLTAAIATDRAKRGEHQAHVTTRTAEGMVTRSLVLEKGARTRTQEEALVSALLIVALARACGAKDDFLLPLRPGERVETRTGDDGLLDWVWSHNPGVVRLDPDGTLTTGLRHPGVALLSGAFNPLHEGHLSLARAAARHLGREVGFELTLDNAEKAGISLEEAKRRAAAFCGVAPLWLTRAPLFSQKAALFPHSAFVIGADTAARLVQPRFYGDDPARMNEAFAAVRRAGCHFLVAGRLMDGRFLTLNDLDIPDAFRYLSEGFSEEAFRVDLSSTELRAREGKLT